MTYVGFSIHFRSKTNTRIVEATQQIQISARNRCDLLPYYVSRTVSFGAHPRRTLRLVISASSIKKSNCNCSHAQKPIGHNAGIQSRSGVTILRFCYVQTVLLFQVEFDLKSLFCLFVFVFFVFFLFFFFLFVQWHLVRCYSTRQA